MLTTTFHALHDSEYDYEIIFQIGKSPIQYNCPSQPDMGYSVVDIMALAPERFASDVGKVGDSVVDMTALAPDRFALKSAR